MALSSVLISVIWMGITKIVVLDKRNRFVTTTEYNYLRGQLKRKSLNTYNKLHP
jgi:hypothetical protein